MSSTQADRLRHRHALRLPAHEGLVDRRELDSKSYADLLTELHGEVCTANTGAAARAAAARARWNRPVT